MSGHSKWTQIKRQKGVVDARRGQLFTKLGREITMAARDGGGNPDSNLRLRLAIQKARANNMPMENIERAIKRGTGEGGEGIALEEVVYEGYGPGGAAVMLLTMTDNRNRTVSDVRNTFARGGGSMGPGGCVSWIFEPKGVIIIQVEKEVAEELALRAIDAGAEDVKVEKTYLEIHTKPEDMESIKKALEERDVKISSAEVSMVAKTVILLQDKDAMHILKLLDRLEELDDVQRVFTNADFSSEVLERYRSEG